MARATAFFKLSPGFFFFSRTGRVNSVFWGISVVIFYGKGLKDQKDKKDIKDGMEKDVKDGMGKDVKDGMGQDVKDGMRQERTQDRPGKGEMR